MKILITGFDPFGGEKINPAFESLKKLPNTINGASIHKLEIPTVNVKSIDKIIEAIKEINPDVVLSIGQAGGRFEICVERIGINLNDYRIKDNEGNQPINEKIDQDGPDAYFTTLPVNAMVKKIKDNNIPAQVSYTAGTFVCNSVMYGTLNYIANNNLNIKSGFIHIPYMYEQVMDKKNMPAMDINTISKALTHAVEAIIETDTDINISSGDIC